MKIFRRIAAAFLLVALMIGVSGCAGGGDLSIHIDRTITDKKLQYSFFANDMAAHNDDNRIMAKWEEMFNADITLEGSGADWMETLSLRINSNDLPDILVLDMKHIFFLHLLY